jgi:hypothetical protein
MVFCYPFWCMSVFCLVKNLRRLSICGAILVLSLDSSAVLVLVGAVGRIWCYFGFGSVMYNLFLFGDSVMVLSAEFGVVSVEESFW